MIAIKKKEVLVENIVIPANYVLIKPDENYTEYQYRGRETGILSSDFSYDSKGRRVSVKSRNYSVMGTVYAVPRKLRYHVRRANRLIAGRKAMKEVNGVTHIVDRSVFDEVNHLKTVSVQFETSVEVSPGDRVRFSYMAHETAKTNQGFIETDMGLMYLVRYDDLYMVIDDNKDPVKCINGYILVRPDRVETKVEDGVSMVEGKGGIVIVTEATKEKRKRKIASGTVLCGSSPVSGYKDLPYNKDEPSVHERGDRVFYDPRGGVRMEMMNHQEYSEDDLVLIRRPDIYISSRNNPDFDKLDFKL